MSQLLIWFSGHPMWGGCLPQWPRIWVQPAALCCMLSPLSFHPFPVNSSDILSKKAQKAIVKQNKKQQFQACSCLYFCVWLS